MTPPRPHSIPIRGCTYILMIFFKNAKGELQSVDGYMNIALEKTEEFINGQLRKVYGDAFVRGNNGMHQSR